MIDIIYKDNNIVVCIKPSGILSTDEDNGMPGLLMQQLKLKETPHTVHRLDQVVSGLMVFALNNKAASDLSKQITDNKFQKRYLAVAHGIFEDKKGIMEDLLFRDSTKNVTYVVNRMRKGVRDASLKYEVLDEKNECSLVDINLITGRTHQIRAQFSHRKHMLLGDKKYGASSDNCQVALWSYYLSFTNPETHKKVEYKCYPPNIFPWNQFDVYDTERKFQCFQRKKCENAKFCNGCKYIDLSYEEQLNVKQKILTERLSKFCNVNPIIGMEYPYNYRNKVTRAFGVDKKGKPVCGIFKQNSHVLVPVNDCLLEDKSASEIINYIFTSMSKFKIIPFDEMKQTGYLRYVQIRRSETTKEIMVILVVAQKIFKLQKQFVEDLVSKFPDITTIVLNYNNQYTPVILGKEFKVIYGKGYIEDILCNYRFRISPGAFYQINNKLTDILYSTAINYADLQGEENVLDAYCGTGTIGICASNKAKWVVGVEINKNAFKDALVNIKNNKIENYYCNCNDSTAFINNLDKKQPFDVAFIDPPRSGCDDKFLSTLMKHYPKKIVYISCNPETLERDLNYISKYYKATYIQGFDMFPYTEHVETVVLLSGEKVDGHINIDLDTEKLENKVGTATYAEIKDYIKEKYGFSVTSLYIGQIKDKVGIKDRKNYNTGSGKGSVPTCPKEKEEAIMDAFKHFGLV